MESSIGDASALDQSEVPHVVNIVALHMAAYHTSHTLFKERKYKTEI